MKLPEDTVTTSRSEREAPTPGRASRVSWGIVDQAASSLTNLALAVLVGRAVPAGEFGRFSAVVLVYQLLNGALRGALSEPVVVLFGKASRRSSEKELERSLGGAVGLGLLSGVVIAIPTVLFTSGSTRTQFLILAATMWGLQLQDAVRYCAITMRHARAAAFNDILWGVLFVAVSVPIVNAGGDEAAPYLLAWCLTGTFAGLVGLLQLRMWIDIRFLGFLRRHRTMAGAYAFEATAQRGAPRLASIAAGFTAGINDFAGLRGALLFANQLVVLTQAARLVAVPEGVRSENPDETQRVANVTMALLSGITFVVGAALLVAPDSLGRQLLGDTWQYAQPLLPMVMLRQFLSAVALGPEIVLRAFANAASSFRARLVNSVLLIVFGTVGAVISGAQGCAIGMAGAQFISTVVWFAASRAVLAEARREHHE